MFVTKCCVERDVSCSMLCITCQIVRTKLHGQLLLLLLLSVTTDMLCTALVLRSVHTLYRKPFRKACI